jgi:SDR family mycofactocin-dependent oxidoreductase
VGLLENKVALITGAARGQGRSHAVTLAEEGADVAVIDVWDHEVHDLVYPKSAAEDLDCTAERVRAMGRRVLTYKADVRDQAALNEVVERTLAEFGHIDIVSANAGIYSDGLSWEMPERHWQDVIDINLTGVWHTVKAVAPAMIEANRGGSIILTSSVAGLQGVGNLGAYVAAKHGVVGLVGTLANELGPYNIRVNAVVPGIVDTDMAFNDGMYRLFRPDLDNPTREDALEVFKTLPLLPSPWIEPRDISNAVLWLASERARCVTGVSIPIDSGQMAKYG